jgi:hypothetical protein
MICAEGVLKDLQGPSKQWFRVAPAVCRLKQRAKSDEADGDVGVILSEGVLVDFQGPSRQRLGFRQRGLPGRRA